MFAEILCYFCIVALGGQEAAVDPCMPNYESHIALFQKVNAR